MNVIGIIFANDAAMGELTDKRTTASIPFGGRYRQVDFALSNMANAGIRRMAIISRSNYQSLMNHIGSGEEWGLEMGEGGLEFLTPYAYSSTDSYRGKLESIHAGLDFLRYSEDADYVVLMDTAVLSNIDISKVIAAHKDSGKDITLVTKAGIADGKKVLDLAMKLDDKGEVADMVVDYAAPADYVASMDIFVMSKKLLVERVKEHFARSLYHMDRDFVMGQWRDGKISVGTYAFEGTALYNESIEEYYRNSLALIDNDVRHDLFGGAHPIYTKVRDRVPSFYEEGCKIENSILADGCSLSGHVKHSVLFRQVTIGSGAQVEDAIIMNDSMVGENAELRCVILDKDVTVRPGTKLIGTPSNPIIVKRGEIV